MDMAVCRAGRSFLALQGLFCSTAALETARTPQILPLPACLLLSESGKAVTHCNPLSEGATALGAAPGRQESQSDWLRAH